MQGGKRQGGYAPLPNSEDNALVLKSGQKDNIARW